MKLPKYASLVLKIAAAVAVIYWMAHSGKLDFNRIGHAFEHWPLALFIIVALYAQIAINSWRWNILNSALGFTISYWEAFSLSMIGNLFTMVIPGSVGGDVIKAYYVGTRVPNRRAHAFTSILMDRVLGLLSLLTLGVAGVVWNFHVILLNKAMTALASFVVLAFLGGTAGLLGGLFFSSQVTRLFRRLEGRLPLAHQVVRCCEALEAFRARPSVLGIGVLMSLPAQLGGCYCVHVAMMMVGANELPLERFLLAVPMGLISTVIPVTPGGIGIGQAAFNQLFEMLSPGMGGAGADAFTVFQALQMGVNLTGIFHYLSFNRMEPPTPVAEAPAVA